MISRLNYSLKKISQLLERIILGFDAVAMSSIVIIIAIQVVARYVFNRSLAWSEEISKYITVWIVFLSTGYVLGNKQHVTVDLIFNAVPLNIKFFLYKIFSLIYLVFSFLMIKYGFSFYKLGRGVTASSFEFPLGFFYLAIPISGFLMIFYSITLLLEKKGDEK